MPTAAIIMEMLMLWACVHHVQIVEEYLQQYKMPSGMMISNSIWKELFSEVVKR